LHLSSELDVPSIEDLSEIESSSRLRSQNGAIYLSAPLINRADSDQPLTTPVGFVLTRERLITVRFEELSSSNTFANRDLAAESTAEQCCGVCRADGRNCRSVSARSSGQNRLGRSPMSLASGSLAIVS
jgi:hypothetical protein